MEATEVPDEWEQVKTEWEQTKQFGYQAVIQAAKVGQMLMDLKTKTKHGEFKEKVQHAALLEYRTAANLMKLADNLPLLEQRKPDSQRAALKLIRDENPKPKKEPATPAATPAAVVLRLKQSDFDLIRECLSGDLKERFELAKA